MRIYLTGATGFVGSNLAHVFSARHGAEVVAPGHEDVDLNDPVMVRRSVAATRPTAIVHAAIWNDPQGLLGDRRQAWETYVSATRHLVDAANAIGAPIVLISTDWVFDGTQGPASETEPPHPINAYGFLKASSELVVAQRAQDGTIARIAGVQGHVGESVPRDTRLDAAATAARLDVELPTVGDMLARLRDELESSGRPLSAGAACG